jgi:hypothetical protein
MPLDPFSSGYATPESSSPKLSLTASGSPVIADKVLKPPMFASWKENIGVAEQWKPGTVFTMPKEYRVAAPISAIPYQTRTWESRGSLIGFIYLIPSTFTPDDHTQGELNIGVYIEPSYRHKGYASQASILTLKWAFEVRSFHRVQALVMDDGKGEKERATGMFVRMYVFSRCALVQYGADEPMQELYA